MKTLNRGMFTTVRTDWRTPKELHERLDAEFHFNLDPCPGARSFDGLLIEWHGVVFVNPPYGREIGKWTTKGRVELEAGRAKQIVWLVPARTDTRWFQDDLLPFATQIRFIRGRLRFDDAKGSAPFPSCIVVTEARP